MPALITHDFFGRDVYDRLYTFIGGSRDEAEAFLLGNQGPDPLFYTVLSPQLREHNRLGSTMHNKKPSELLAALKNSLSILGSAEQEVGRAYALGFLCHYTLDSTMHPFVFFHEYQVCDAGEPGLSRADGSEVHGVIESELDELVLFEKRAETVATFNPSAEILNASDFVLRIISKMYAYVALTVYGEIIPATMFETAVKDFRIAQRLFYSPSGRKRAIIGRVEELLRPYSFYRSMSHRPVALTTSQFDNRAHEAWENPFTGEVRTVGFWDLFDEALEKAQDNLFAFDEDTFDLAAAQEITRELDFSGEPVVALVVSVEDGARVADEA
ncbi:zinc dependent phospholipase C family protein [Eggerthella sinensis]|uniref:zinc dependent phospholipase C family protein n=1 Tax=Eggerthella sinensis TaxID=242230 RepID=UPI00266BDCCA|nr:zinc dependent phospholipase C family protein [Eggerthella sinensis]